VHEQQCVNDIVVARVAAAKEANRPDRTGIAR
jgi:hypothetical protein